MSVRVLPCRCEVSEIGDPEDGYCVMPCFDHFKLWEKWMFDGGPLRHQLVTGESPCTECGVCPNEPPTISMAHCGACGKGC